MIYVELIIDFDILIGGIKFVVSNEFSISKDLKIEIL